MKKKMLQNKNDSCIKYLHDPPVRRNIILKSKNYAIYMIFLWWGLT